MSGIPYTVQKWWVSKKERKKWKKCCSETELKCRILFYLTRLTKKCWVLAFCCRMQGLGWRSEGGEDRDWAGEGSRLRGHRRQKGPHRRHRPRRSLQVFIFFIFFNFMYCIQHCFICRPPYIPLCLGMLGLNPESISTLPPFGPIEGQKWFDQISCQ
jgi:hypothetical protein